MYGLFTSLLDRELRLRWLGFGFLLHHDLALDDLVIRDLHGVFTLVLDQRRASLLGNEVSHRGFGIWVLLPMQCVERTHLLRFLLETLVELSDQSLLSNLEADERSDGQTSHGSGDHLDCLVGHVAPQILS